MTDPDVLLDDLSELGYEVGVAFEFDDFTLYRVEGFGVSTQVRTDDLGAIASIVASHEARVEQIAEQEAAELARAEEAAADG